METHSINGEWEGDKDVTDATFADGTTEIKESAFSGCTGLNNLRFLEGSEVTAVGERRSGAQGSSPCTGWRA
jgi:hypothetical protein